MSATCMCRKGPAAPFCRGIQRTQADGAWLRIPRLVSICPSPHPSVIVKDPAGLQPRAPGSTSSEAWGPQTPLNNQLDVKACNLEQHSCGLGGPQVEPQREEQEAGRALSACSGEAESRHQPCEVAPAPQHRNARRLWDRQARCVHSGAGGYWWVTGSVGQGGSPESLGRWGHHAGSPRSALQFLLAWLLPLPLHPWTGLP
ncbi:uncharacterized protein LOC116756133 [Phocoena sinus]|uniref:uncharacterized protein LOC116756133 n=1 Tax=Phocoena sinus TaxID=42100 RepID=UPI0013C5378E|nr:uncharacterized protein LOC116756133 [Phocoena sinus]